MEQNENVNKRKPQDYTLAILTRRQGGKCHGICEILHAMEQLDLVCTEYNPEEGLFFGKVHGIETEMGYFSLAELESVHGPAGLKIERDRGWTPRPLSECK